LDSQKFTLFWDKWVGLRGRKFLDWVDTK